MAVTEHKVEDIAVATPTEIDFNIGGESKSNHTIQITTDLVATAGTFTVLGRLNSGVAYQTINAGISIDATSLSIQVFTGNYEAIQIVPAGLLTATTYTTTIRSA